jgi:hypothetical protein
MPARKDIPKMQERETNRGRDDTGMDIDMDKQDRGDIGKDACNLGTYAAIVLQLGQPLSMKLKA